MIKDYILQQDNAVSDEWCDRAIELFNSAQYVNRSEHLRITPKKGRLVICPAFWTHFHRGNPPISGEKYMINGWMEFADG